MFADRVKETSSSTGVGDFTLSGAATGFRSFNSAFGVGRNFIYWIIDDINNDWETGVGALSASSTLVRKIVQDSSQVGSPESGPPTFVNFQSGSKDVFCGLNAACSFPEMDINKNADLRFAYDLRQMNPNTGAFTGLFMFSDLVYYQSFFISSPSRYSGVAVDCTATHALADLSFGIYSIRDGGPDKKLIEIPTRISLATTGLKQVSFETPIWLLPGYYYMAFGIDAGNAEIRAYPTYDIHEGLNGLDQFVQTGLLFATSSITDANLPSTATDFTLSEFPDLRAAVVLVK